MRGRPALTIDRLSVRTRKIVYVAVADAAVRYAQGSSRIVYIGTTRNGISRVAGSAARHAECIFSLRGVREISFHILTCRGRRRVPKMWHKLERALILSFRELYGEPPYCNIHGVNTRWTDEQEYFSLAGLQNALPAFA